jgi:murein DD-endopeptidase MepM/ murein hydrolase activator NlpD
MVRPARLGRATALLVLATGVVAAFATIAPAPQAELAPASTIRRELLPVAAESGLMASPESYVREERLRRGDTLAAFLARLGVADAHIERLLRLRPLRLLAPETDVTAKVSAEGVPFELSFLAGRDTLVWIALQGERFVVGEERAPLETVTAMKSSAIRSSLFSAADAAGIPDAIAIQLAEVFGGDIDFHRDLRQGDRFSVVYEMHLLAGRPVRAGRLLAAEFVNRGRTLRAVHFAGWGGRTGYYAPDGRNLRKAFLRSPLEFSRVSSGFGMRVHPFLRQWRAHRGIDYAAPAGTRVRSVGDGVVEFAGARGGYGTMVIVRHYGQYSTAYAHLSRIARGVQRGTRVAQGDVLGLVGRTGWATGPHLHYEFRIAGESRNPLTVATPAGQPVAPQEMAAFLRHVEPLAARLALLAGSQLALLE